MFLKISQNQSSIQDQSNLATQGNSALGVIDYRAVVQAAKSTKTNKRKHYHGWTEKERYSIGKYAAEDRCAAAVRKFKEKTLNKSTARRFAKFYKEEIKDTTKEKRDPKKALAVMPSGRPLLLGTSR